MLALHRNIWILRVFFIGIAILRFAIKPLLYARGISGWNVFLVRLVS